MKRKNIKLSDDLAIWFEERAEQIGMSQTSLMALACQQYREQQEAMQFMRTLDGKIDKLENMKNQLKG